MKLLFLQKDPLVKIAVMLLSAILKKNGHQCELLMESDEKNMTAAIFTSKPDIIAFSCTTGSERWALQKAKEVKEKIDVLVIVGGPHATFFPEIINDPSINIVCRGEGEYAVAELLNALERNSDISKIRNIWVKKNGGVVKNDVRPLIDDLDTLPLPDWDIYSTKYKFLVPYYQGNFPVITSRGCPHKCSYCFNASYKKLYDGRGKYIRRENPENAINKLIEAKQKHKIRRFNFVDDCFVAGNNWLEAFSELYRKKVKLPFVCNVRADSVNEKSVRILKEMGCYCARMGIESGNNRVRREILNKYISEAQIRNAAFWVRKFGIKLLAYNIYGSPGETLEEAFDTYKLNREIKVDFAQCSILEPYPGTKIKKYAEDLKVIDDDPIDEFSSSPRTRESFFVSSVLKLEHKKEIMNLQKLTQFFIRWHVPFFLAKLLIKLPENGIFHFIFRMEYAYFRFRLDLKETIPFIKFGLRSKSYISRNC